MRNRKNRTRKYLCDNYENTEEEEKEEERRGEEEKKTIFLLRRSQQEYVCHRSFLYDLIKLSFTSVA